MLRSPLSIHRSSFPSQNRIQIVTINFTFNEMENLLSVQLLSHVQFFAIPWTAARQASLSITNSQSLLQLMSIESVMPSNLLILCHPLLVPHSIFPSIGVFQMSQFFSSGGQSNAYIVHLLGFSSRQSLKTLLHESLEAEAWSYPKAVLLFLGCSSLVPASPLFPD